MAGIDFHASKKMDFVYQPEHINLPQSVEPVARRLDTLTPNNSTQSQDTYILQQPKSYMNLRIKRTDYFNVTISDKTQAPAANTASTSPGLIDNWNTFLDNLALSKAINGLSIKWGNSTLESTSNDRNPWLLEVKSSQFDLEQCKRYGLVPLAFSGIEALSGVLPDGVLSQTDYKTIGNATLVAPLDNPDVVLSGEFVKKQTIMNSKRRVEIVGTPVFTTSQAGVTLTATNINTAYFGTWIPLNGASVYYSGANTLTGTFVIKVTEYLVDDFLTTPYQKNKTEKCIAVAPASFVTFSFQFDTKYINNGMLSYVNKAGTGSSVAIQRSLTTNVSSIEVETFDFNVPPRPDYSLKIIAWRPTRLQAPTVSLANGVESSSIVVNDQQSTIIPPYYLVSSLPEFWNGDLNSQLPAGYGPQNIGTFVPADITECQIQIGQTTITENIPMSELKKMSADLMRNPELAAWVSNQSEFYRYAAGAIPYLRNSRGCPFLLLDVGKLSMLNSTDCLQQMPNVEYPTVQTVKISFKIKPDYLNQIFSGNVTYTPHVYKFYPYLYEQREGKAMVRTPLSIPYNDVVLSNIANNIPMIQGSQFDYEMIGNGWFEDVQSFLSKHGEKIAKAVLGAVRIGRDLTKDSSRPEIHKALNFISDIAHSHGYGKNRALVHRNKRANF